MIKYGKHCKFCGEELTPDNWITQGDNRKKGYRYVLGICRPCKNARQRDWVKSQALTERTCVVCGKTFSAKYCAQGGSSRETRYHRQTCSTKCRHTLQSQTIQHKIKLRRRKITTPEEFSYGALYNPFG